MFGPQATVIRLKLQIEWWGQRERLGSAFWRRTGRADGVDGGCSDGQVWKLLSPGEAEWRFINRVKTDDAKASIDRCGHQQQDGQDACRRNPSRRDGQEIQEVRPFAEQVLCA